MLTLKIATNNAAFETSENAEVARIMREWADKIDTGSVPVFAPVYDVNGNKVGSITTFKRPPAKSTTFSKRIKFQRKIVKKVSMGQYSTL